jgi:membrane-bound ClpP family serine protease
MEWLTVISLVVIGVALIIVEIIFVPGTTIVGVIGAILAIIGVSLSFSYFGRSIGWITLGSTAFVSGLMFYWSLRTKAWERFSLKSSISSRVNEVDLDVLKIGEEGTAVSTLRPIGKAELAGKIVEVTTLGPYVESGTKIRIARVSTHQIVVEPVI